MIPPIPTVSNVAPDESTFVRPAGNNGEGGERAPPSSPASAIATLK